ncbi:MAG: hypothetical protein IE912_03145 [Brevundimonas diminuta]|nr:hypothetical protein [Brevundimonas diminuta]MBD3817897.1 hypothetical protein [Brevundimonas diminuta]
MMQTIYCVQTYRRQGRQVEAGQLRQFAEETAAVNAGNALAPRVAGVVVYALTGEPEADFWDEPKLLFSHGATPPLPA